MTKNRKDTNLWAYLESTGLLEHGTDEQIKNAKKEYRRQQHSSYRREVRKDKPEFSVALSKKDGSYGKMALAARRHNMPVTTFIRNAALSYLDKSFLVPNQNQVARLEQALMNCLNEIQVITHTKEKYHWEREQKYDAIAARITILETEIRQALCFPLELKGYVESSTDLS